MYHVEFSEGAASKLPLLRKTFPRFAEAERAMRWALEKKPYFYEKINGTDIRIIPTGPFVDSNKCAFAVKAFFELHADNRVIILYFETWPL